MQETQNLGSSYEEAGSRDQIPECILIQDLTNQLESERSSWQDTLIATWVTHNRVGVYTDSPSSLLFKRNTKEKNKKEYCSEADFKVRYIIYTENENAT